jgi:four helix bundle protein
MRERARGPPAQATGGERTEAGGGAPSCRLRGGGGMTHSTPPAPYGFPHHKLLGYQLALELVKLVSRTRIADAHLRQQARKSAASTALNAAEGAARQTIADKSRAYAIALAECCECCAAIEIATALGACTAADEAAVLTLGLRLKNVLSRLVH